MTAVDISGLREHVGETVTVRGWVMTTRSSGKIAFVVLRDGSGYVQGVLSKKEVPDSTWSAFESLTQETSVAVTGDVRASRGRPAATSWRSRAWSAGRQPGLSRSAKEHGTTFLLEHRHLWLRSRRQRPSPGSGTRWTRRSATSSTSAASSWSIPRFSPARSGRKRELFATEYFEQGNAYLAQTGQLYGEAAAAALGKVYCFGPTFRAEKSKTRRHLTEFWMVEPEVAFNDSERQHAAAGGVRRYIVGRVLERRQRGAEGAGARHRPARAGAGALSPHRLHRRGGDAQRSGLRHEVGRRPRAETTRRCSPRSTTGRCSSSTIRRKRRRST